MVNTNSITYSKIVDLLKHINESDELDMRKVKELDDLFQIYAEERTIQAYAKECRTEICRE